MRFDQDSEEADIMEEDLPAGTINMIWGPNDPELENRLRDEIWIIRQMHEVLLVQPLARESESHAQWNCPEIRWTWETLLANCAR